MAYSEDLQELAQIVAASSGAVKDYLSSKNMPQMSFSKGGPLAFPPSPPEIQTARRQLREASKRIYDLASGPAESFLSMSSAFNDCSSLQYIYHYNLPSLVPLGGDITFADLATKSGTNELQLRHVLRYATTNHIFEETKPGYINHSAASKMLLVSPELNALVGHSTDATFNASAKFVQATTQFPDSEELNQSGVNLAFNTDLPVMRFFDQDPLRGPRFGNAMKALAKSEGHNIRYVVDSFDWKSIQGTVVDVGGSFGHASMAIAEAAPQLKFVVQDLPQITSKAEAGLPPQLKERISFVPQDFFRPQSVEADTYFLRFILHNYPDKYAVLILQNLVPVLKHGSKIIVMDNVMPAPGKVPPSEEKVMRNLDMIMMTLLNAHEREIEEWEALFAKADKRLKLKNVVQPPGSVLSSMELVFEA